MTENLNEKENLAFIPENEMFAYDETLVKSEGIITVSYMPKEGEVVYAKRGEQTHEIKLMEAENSGGEGIIFRTDIPNIVAKIYKSKKVGSE